jgi:hypothetical protein
MNSEAQVILHRLWERLARAFDDALPAQIDADLSALDQALAAHVEADPLRYSCGHEVPNGTAIPKFCPQCQQQHRSAHFQGELEADPLATCQWTLDDIGDNSVWETQCKNAFEFTDGGPLENGLKFCGYCGKALVEARTSDDEAE